MRSRQWGCLCELAGEVTVGDGRRIQPSTTVEAESRLDDASGAVHLNGLERLVLLSPIVQSCFRLFVGATPARRQRSVRT